MVNADSVNAVIKNLPVIKHKRNVMFFEPGDIVIVKMRRQRNHTIDLIGPNLLQQILAIWEPLSGSVTSE